MITVAVIGAGAFGGWTALELVRRGARVTLVDAWGPGHTRASSGGETRIIRAGYGSRAIYSRMAARALDRWRAHDARFGTRFYTKTGALWLCGPRQSFGVSSAETMRAAGIDVEALTPAQARRRYPQIDFKGVSTVFFEPDAGFLLARRACEHVAERVAAEGGTYFQAAVSTPLAIAKRRLNRVRLLSGATIEADAFVFACGPWLPSLFPDELARHIRPTRQEVFYFGVPAGDAQFQSPALPVWIDVADRVMYGTPGSVNRGFKVADDTAGPPIDPTSAERRVTPAKLRAVRRFLATRFPALRRAPFIGSEVCQYEASSDAHFVIDRHPRASNVWLAGGGSGHGFKMGPVIGEIVASAVLGPSLPDSTFALSRFDSTGTAARAARDKWS